MIENNHEIKSINQDLPKPIAFNCWKHHFGYVRDRLNDQTSYLSNDNFIREMVQFIGESQFDYYIGSLDATNIATEIIEQLNTKNVLNQITYKEWLCSEGNDYRFISLTDGSNWTLRLGQGNTRFIHIHPSRYSKKTVRVKSSSLKTAYAFLFYYGLSDVEISNEKINFIRNRFVKLPGLKPFSPLTAIRRILDLYLC